MVFVAKRLILVQNGYLMTKPARQTHQAKIFALQIRQFWGVLFLMVAGLLLGLVMGQPQLATKSMMLGALLSYVAQMAFTFIAYRLTGAKARQAIVLHLYLGQVVKWVLTIVGFAMIFMWIKPIIAPVVLLGYILMQFGHNVVMWRSKF